MNNEFLEKHIGEIVAVVSFIVSAIIITTTIRVKLKIMEEKINKLNGILTHVAVIEERLTSMDRRLTSIDQRATAQDERFSHERERRDAERNDYERRK